MIRNTSDIQIIPTRLSQTPATKRGELFIRNTPQLYQDGTSAEVLQQQQEIKETEVVSLNVALHYHQSNPLNRNMTSTELSPPSTCTSFRSVYPEYLHKQPIDDNGNDFRLLTETTTSQQPTINISNDFVDATGNSGNLGSHKSGSNNCERKENQTTNSENYYLPKITVLPNVIAIYRSGNSDS